MTSAAFAFGFLGLGILGLTASVLPPIALLLLLMIGSVGVALGTLALPLIIPRVAAPQTVR